VSPSWTILYAASSTPGSSGAGARASATVAATGPDTLTVTGLPSDRIVEVLGESSVPFSEVVMHRATLEEAYMELTRDAVEFRTVEPGTGRHTAEATR